MAKALVPDQGTEVKNVLFFFPNTEIVDLLSFSVESLFFCEVTSFSHAQEAISALKSRVFDLAVIDTSVAEGMVVFEQFQAGTVPYVLFHPEGKSPEVRGPKIKVFKEGDLLDGIQGKLVALQAVPKTEKSSEGSFVRMSVPLLLRTNPLAADLYIRLSERKYVKLFHRGASFTDEDKLKYHDDKKIPYFYVSRKSLSAVAKNVNSMLEKLLKLPLPVEEASKIGVATVETVHELVRQVGFTPEVQKMVKNNMNLVVKEMMEMPSLAGVLKNMERNKEKYIASHSQLLAEISCAVSAAMEWGSEMSLKKISMAALLHDMCVTDQKVCAVKNLTELEKRKAEFTPEQIEEYKNHPKRAAILIQGMKEVPADVDKIVYQHHELPKGTGFPEAVGHVHIHPLAATLMVTHDLVDWLIEHPGPLNMPAFLSAHSEKYSAGVFKKILKALDTLKV